MNRLYLLNNTFLSIVIQSLILSSIVVEYSSGIRIHDRDFLRSLSITNKLLSRRKISDQNSHPQVLEALHSLKGCPGEICGTLAGEAVSPLLAGANECAQQDMADKIITAAKTEIKDPEVSKKLISLAIEYRKVERNTFPDFSKQPNVDRNSLFCQKVPKNHELDGLIQAQSSTADPNLFFDPKSTSGSTTLTKARTIPFGSKNSSFENSSSTDSESVGDQGTKNSSSSPGITTAQSAKPNSTSSDSDSEEAVQDKEDDEANKSPKDSNGSINSSSESTDDKTKSTNNSTLEPKDDLNPVASNSRVNKKEDIMTSTQGNITRKKCSKSGLSTTTNSEVTSQIPDLSLRNSSKKATGDDKSQVSGSSESNSSVAPTIAMKAMVLKHLNLLTSKSLR